MPKPKILCSECKTKLRSKKEVFVCAICKTTLCHNHSYSLDVKIGRETEYRYCGKCYTRGYFQINYINKELPQ